MPKGVSRGATMRSLLLYLPLCLVLASASPARRQSGSPLLNSSYVNPVFRQSRSAINENSLASINALLAMDDYPNGWIGQNGFAAIAQWDYQHQTKTFQEAFRNNESHYSDNPGGCFMYWHNPLTDCWNDDASWAAMASMEGYKAYSNDTYLQWAEGVQKFITNHGFINRTVIQEGYLKGTHFANNTLKATCDGESLYGGVYEHNGWPYEDADSSAALAASSPQVASASSAAFARLSAQLCGVTGNKFYCSYANETLLFMDRFLIDPTTGLIDGYINGNNCSRPRSFITASTTGNYFAAYAILANLTSNATALAQSRKAALASLTTDVWNTDKGVLAETNATNPFSILTLKSILIRTLGIVHPYMDADMQAAILQYINIQYWSLVNYDSNDPTKPVYYGINWNGPSYVTADGQSQLESLDVLNALSLNPDSAFPNSTTSGVPVISA